MSAEFEKTVLKELNAHNKKFEAIDKKFDAIDKKFDAIDKRFDIVDRQFDLIGVKFDEVDDKLNNIISVLERLCNSVALIEEKMTFDIPALFDGYSMQHNIQTGQRKEIDSLSKKVDNHDIRISILEQKTV